ncbi:MAG TPA: hypothetical protein PL173_10975 [Saprospiraceae bacterium]|nr:hypothetical protein [Saprospiraceae bacterium]HNG13595.1 hypothetical protein [Saprospiraceae bacterium]
MKNILSIIAVLFVCHNINSQIILPENPFDSFGNPSIRKPIEINRNGTHHQDIDINEGNYPPYPPIDPETDGEKYVFWVHGLNGDIGSWIRAADASQNNVANGFPARKLKSVSMIDYTQDANLYGAAQQLGEIIENKRSDQLALGEDPTQNFIIGHSQGGIVTRALLHRDLCLNHTPVNNLGYGGIITFGSPNQGARILNNKHLFNDMSVDMCKSLGAGPAEELSQKTEADLFIFKINVGKIIPVKDIVDNICTSFVGNLVDLAVMNQTPNITQSYYVGAPDITNISNCSDQDLVSFPKVAFYGIEPPEGLLFRTGAYFLKSPNEFDYFQANDDYFLTNAFIENKKKYDAAVAKWEYYYFLAQVERIQYCKLPNVLLDWPMCLSAKKREMQTLKILNAYKQGQDWFNRVDDQYKTIIGAIDYTKTTQWYCECENVKTGQFTSTPVAGPGDCPPSSKNGIVCSPVEYTIFSQIKKDSDGVVLSESAMNIPYATAPPRKMYNSSHMQMRNDDNTKKALLEIYDGDVGPAYKTAKKN